MLTPTHAASTFRFYIPIKKRIYYNGVNPGDIQKNGIYMLTNLDTPDSSVNPVDISYYMRLSYLDA